MSFAFLWAMAEGLVVYHSPAALLAFKIEESPVSIRNAHRNLQVSY
jgi:hypothetical protein